MSKSEIQYSNVIGLFIRSLRMNPRRKDELRELVKERFPKASDEAVRKACERCLKQLEGWGLTEKRGDKICWVYYPHLVKGENLQSKVEHSKKLIPALFVAAGISEPAPFYGRELRPSLEVEEKLNVKAAEEHLQCYPNLWPLIEDYRYKRRCADELEDKVKAGFLEKLEAEFGRDLKEYRPGVNRFVSKGLASEVYGYIYSRLQPERDSEGNVKNVRYYGNLTEVLELFRPPPGPPPDPQDLWWRGTLIAKGADLHEKIKDFIYREVADESSVEAVKAVYRARLEAWQVAQNLEREILILKHKIESGEPLKGRCFMCPELEVGT